jgi:hypothetical protein
MNTDVEELLREGMDRFTAGVEAPPGLARAAVRLRRRRRAVRAAVACGAAAVIAVAAIAVTGVAVGAPARPGAGLAQARTAAYVISRVENALAIKHLVLRGYTTSGGWGPTVSWYTAPAPGSWSSPAAAAVTPRPAAGLGAAALIAPGLPTASAARVPGPVLMLEAAQRSITLDSFGGTVFPDPGIWIAALGSPLQFDLRREPYTSPITITQVIHPPFGGTIRRPLPSSLLDGWNGLRGFLVLTIRNSAGRVVVSEPVSFCPNAYDPERAGPGAPPTTHYPPQCLSSPFVKGMV